MRRNSGDRWLIWSDLDEHQRRYRASSSRPPRRSRDQRWYLPS
jgi:hypothetical protein